MAMRIRQYDALHIARYPRCQWMLPLGKYSPHIAPVDAMVINLGVKESSCVGAGKFWKVQSTGIHYSTRSHSGPFRLVLVYEVLTLRKGPY